LRFSFHANHNPGTRPSIPRLDLRQKGDIFTQIGRKRESRSRVAHLTVDFRPGKPSGCAEGVSV
jgi:hypothetical protein